MSSVPSSSKKPQFFSRLHSHAALVAHKKSPFALVSAIRKVSKTQEGTCTGLYLRRAQVSRSHESHHGSLERILESPVTFAIVNLGCIEALPALAISDMELQWKSPDLHRCQTEPVIYDRHASPFYSSRPFGLANGGLNQASLLRSHKCRSACQDT